MTLPHALGEIQSWESKGKDESRNKMEGRRIMPRMVAMLGMVLAGSPAQVDLEYLRTLTLDILAQSRVAPGTNGPPGWGIKNSVGFSLVTPGRRGYPAFWIRDFSMACDSGLVPTEELTT